MLIQHFFYLFFYLMSSQYKTQESQKVEFYNMSLLYGSSKEESKCKLWGDVQLNLEVKRLK